MESGTDQARVVDSNEPETPSVKRIKLEGLATVSGALTTALHVKPSSDNVGAAGAIPAPPLVPTVPRIFTRKVVANLERRRCEYISYKPNATRELHVVESTDWVQTASFCLTGAEEENVGNSKSKLAKVLFCPRFLVMNCVDRK